MEQLDTTEEAEVSHQYSKKTIWKSISHFCNNVWHSFEPILKEFCLHALIFVFVAILSWLVAPIIPIEFKDTYKEIKKIFLLLIFGLLGVHGILIIIIRILESIVNEIRRALINSKKSNNNDEMKNIATTESSNRSNKEKVFTSSKKRK